MFRKRIERNLQDRIDTPLLDTPPARCCHAARTALGASGRMRSASPGNSIRGRRTATSRRQAEGLICLTERFDLGAVTQPRRHPLRFAVVGVRRQPLLVPLCQSGDGVADLVKDVMIPERQHPWHRSVAEHPNVAKEVLRDRPKRTQEPRAEDVVDAAARLIEPQAFTDGRRRPARERAPARVLADVPVQSLGDVVIAVRDPAVAIDRIFELADLLNGFLVEPLIGGVQPHRFAPPSATGDDSTTRPVPPALHKRFGPLILTAPARGVNTARSGGRSVPHRGSVGLISLRWKHGALWMR